MMVEEPADLNDFIPNWNNLDTEEKIVARESIYRRQLKRTYGINVLDELILKQKELKQ